MGLFDDIKREFEKALQEAAAQGQQAKQKMPGWVGSDKPAPGLDGPARPVSARPGGPRQIQQADQRQTSSAPTLRSANGRLEKEQLQRIAGPPPLIPAEPSAEDFRRKVQQLEGDHGNDAPGSLPAGVFDLDLPPAVAAAPPLDPPAGITFTAREVLRALILGEVIDEPKGRRGRRPHRPS